MPNRGHSRVATTYGEHLAFRDSTPTSGFLVSAIARERLAELIVFGTMGLEIFDLLVERFARQKLAYPRGPICAGPGLGDVDISVDSFRVDLSVERIVREARQRVGQQDVEIHLSPRVGMRRELRA